MSEASAPSRPRRAPAREVIAAVARRELGALFGQPAAWVFLAAFLAIAALLALRGFFERNVSDLRDAFAGLRWAFVLLAPAAAMRLWAEERRAGTDELLLTLPIRPWEAVLGKYLAGLALIGVALALAALIPLSLAPFAELDPGQLAAGALGALLLGAAFLAVGLLASALTRSQEVAFLLGAGACLALNLLGDPALVERAARALPEGLWAFTAGNLAVGPHYEALTRGVLDGRAVVAFAGLSAVALLGAVLAIERREPGRQAFATAALAVVALLLAVDLAAQPALLVRADLTLRRSNSLSEATRELLARARGQVTVRAYLSAGIPEEARPLQRRLLDLLRDVEAAAGGAARVEVVDPTTPELQEAAERHGVRRFQLQVKQEGGAAFRTVYAGVVVFHGARPPAAIPVALDPALHLEYELALALRRVLLPRQVVALGGEGAETYGAARALLERPFEVRALDLAREPEVPRDVTVVVYTAPRPPAERALYALDQFVARGGRLVLLTEGHGRADAIDPWRLAPHEQGALARALEAWGLALGPGLVLQEPHRAWPLKLGEGQVQAYYPWFLTPGPQDNGTSPIGAGLGRVVLPFASEIRALGPEPEAGERIGLLFSEPAWTLEGEQSNHPARDLGAELAGRERAPRVLAAGVRGRLGSAWRGGLAPARPEPEDGVAAGEDPLATPLSEPAGEGRVVVVGDADFARDAWREHGPGGAELLLDLVEWAEGDARLSAIRARAAAPPLRRTDAAWLGVEASAAVWWLDLAGLPLLVLGLGLGRLALLERRREQAASRRRAEGS